MINILMFVYIFFRKNLIDEKIYQLARFKHENILPLERIYIEPSLTFDKPSCLFIVTKFLDEDLDTFLEEKYEKKQYIETNVLLEYFFQLSSTMLHLVQNEYIHKHGIFISDNIHLSQNGKQLIVDVFTILNKSNIGKFFIISM